MKLSDWARQNGLCYKTAHRLFQTGKLPLRSEQLPTGTILIYPESPMTQQVLIYGRVSSHDQKEDLARQLDRLRTFCASKGWVVAKEVSEIGSGLNGRRQGLLGVLSSPKWTVIVVEHRDRLSRFGVDFIEAALKSAGRHLVVVNAAEDKHDLVQDFIDVVTSMCSRIYGQRSAKNRAARAIKAAADEVSQ